MAYNRWLFIVVFALPFLFSCEKEKGDDIAPTIVINTPTEGQAYNVLDFITINATITDNKQINSVSIGLLNSNYVPVQSMVSVEVGTGPQLNFTKSYALYDIRLETGVYYVWINAFDGENQTNAYQRIDVTAVPKKLTGIYTVSKISASLMGLVKIDSVFNWTQLATYASDYSGSSISSYEQLLFLSGRNTGDTKAINVENGSVKWTIPYPLGFAPHCMDNYHADKITYASYRAGTINGYNFNGSNYFLAYAASNYYPEKLFKHNSYLLSEQKPYTPGTAKLLVYLPTGTPIQEQLLAQDVVVMYKKESTKAFVFGNNTSQQGVMEIYDISGNSFWSPHTLPAAKLLSVEQVDSNVYLIGMDNNTIYKYSYHNNTLVIFVSGIKPNCIRYNEADDEVIVADDTRVQSYAYPSGSLKNSVTLADTIYNIHLLYNR